MVRRLLLPVCGILLLAMAGCHDDPAPVICRPETLLLGTDSIVYTYDENNRISLVSYYDVSHRKTDQDDFGYNEKGQLVIVARSLVAFDGSTLVSSHNTIAYDDNGQPVSVTSDSFGGHYTTTFTHANGRLAQVQTTRGFQQSFVGTSRFQYDDNGNITKVFYTLNINQQITEVLARENLSFDDKEKFYVNTPELKTCYEYVYGFLPNKNNCLSSTVYYYSYAQRFVSPQSVTFAASYDDGGLIKSLQSSTSMQLNSGDVLFKKVMYNCR